ncbi:hypothetical protein [Streptomyces alkaliphilus]|uniref:hypothetical protein n=1 Tax=Streptomyces alkaliphilus TaxID=1472722 RepID=UPI00117E4360|nr:hypothetical protein [Streptomyces alkaliphilus]
MTSPQTRLALARRHRPPHGLLAHGAPGAPGDGHGNPAEHALDEEVFRRQRRLAIRTMLLLATLLFGLSGLLALWPAPDPTRIAGIPASWLLLMTASYPLLLLSAVIHVRRAERIEREAPDGRGGRVIGPRPAPGPAPHPPSDTVPERAPDAGERT